MKCCDYCTKPFCKTACVCIEEYEPKHTLENVMFVDLCAVCRKRLVDKLVHTVNQMRRAEASLRDQRACNPRTGE